MTPNPDLPRDPHGDVLRDIWRIGGVFWATIAFACLVGVLLYEH